MLVRLLLISVALVLLSERAPGQRISDEEGRPLFVQRYGVQDYDGNEQNWNIAQDHRGVIFVANRRGVLEYDGLQWQNRSIPNLFARSLDVTSAGEVCVGGVKEIGCFKADSSGTLNYRSLVELIPEAHRDFADVWTTIALADGVYFQTAKRVFRWDGHEIQSWAAQNRFHKAFGVNGRLFVRDEDIGLFEFVSGGLVLVPGGGQFASERIDAMVPIGDDRVLLVTRSSGALVWSREGFQPFATEIDQFLRDHRIYTGIALPDMGVALATTSGSVLIINEDGDLRGVLGANVGIDPDELVLDLHVDHQGGLWIALDTGILRVDLASPLTYFDSERGLDGLVYDIVRYDDRLLVSTSQGLYELQGSVNQIGEEGSGARFLRIANLNQQIWRISQTGNGLLAAASEGVYFLENGKPAQRIIDSPALVFQQSSSDPEVYFVGLRGGLGILEFQEGAWVFGGLIEELDVLDVRSLHDPGDGSLWIGTTADGLSRAWLDGTTVTRHERYGESHGLPAGYAYLLGHPDETLEVMTREGVFAVEEWGTPPTFTRVEFYDRVLEWPDETGYLVNVRGGDQVWVVSDGGISSYRADADGIVDVTPNALRFSSIPLRHLFVDHDGVIWIAGEQGLIRYDPDVEKDYAVSYPALVREVVGTGGARLFGGFASDALAIPEISFDSNNLRFKVSAASYNEPETNQFQYWLEGFDSGWSEWTSEAYKDYTNLSEGRYQFRVRARNVHGIISEEATFIFIVLPPWYRTWWAYSLYILAGLGILWGYGQWRLRAHRVEMERERRVRESLEVANERLREANERLHRADQLKDDLLANTSHELRTPLTSILGFASVLSEELDGEYRDFAEHIQRSGGRLLNTVNALLDMARLQADTIDFQAETFSVSDAVRKVVETHAEDARAKNLYLTVLPEDLPISMTCDRRSFERVVDNLVSNAVKFTESGGVTILVDTDGANAHITIKDTGIGIGPDFLPNMFGEFQQASTGYDRTYEGNGLGLAITHRLVRLLGGSISVDTQLGEGTAIHVTIPRGTQEVIASGGGVPMESEIPRSSGVVLFIENGDPQPDVIEPLRAFGRLQIASCVDEVVDIARTREVDLLVFDAARDSKLGLSVPAMLRESGIDAAVVIITGHAMPGDRKRWLAAGYVDHIARPFSKDRLLLALDAALPTATAV